MFSKSHIACLWQCLQCGKDTCSGEPSRAAPEGQDVCAHIYLRVNQCLSEKHRHSWQSHSPKIDMMVGSVSIWELEAAQGQYPRPQSAL